MDAAYLEDTVAAALVSGLAATVEEQPADSVAFLGEYLLKYVQTEQLKAKLAAEDAQAEVDAKEASAKASAEAAAAAPAVAAAEAAAAKEAALASKLEAADIVDAALFTEVMDHVQSITGATGVYVALKEGELGPEVPEGEEPDEDAPKASLRYLAGSSDHADVLDKKLTQPAGVTWPVWRLPVVEGEDDEDEEEEDEENPKEKPPPPELQPLHISNILRSNAEFHRIPRLGAYLAVPFAYDNLTHEEAIPPPEEEAEKEEAPADDDEGKEGEEGGKEEEGEAEPGEKPIPAGRVVRSQAAVCLDTMGTNKRLSSADIAATKLWADRLAAAMNRSEANQYVINYKQHLVDLAAAAEAAAKQAEADAAAAAAEAADEGGD